MKPTTKVFLTFALGPLAVGWITFVAFGDFPIGVLSSAAILFAALLYKPDRLIDWLDAPLKKENNDRDD